MSYESWLTCDECGEKQPSKEARATFIEQHIHAFPYKASKTGYPTTKHFCSQACRRVFLENYANLNWEQFNEAELRKSTAEYTEEPA